MSWIMPVLSAVVLSLGLDTLPNQPKVDEKCEPAAVVTVDQLGEMLTVLGYAPVEQRNPDGTIPGYKSELTSWDYTVPVYFRTSEDGKSLTITAVLAGLGDMENVSANDLAAFLQRNNLANNPYVYGINEHSMLTLQITIPLGGMTQDSLRETMWNLEEELIASEDLWFLYSPVSDDLGNFGPNG